MDHGLAVKHWRIVEHEHEGEVEHEAKARRPLRFGDGGIENQIEMSGKDLDRPGIRFTVELDGGSDAIEFDCFEVIEQHPHKLVGRFVARGREAAAGRLLLIVAIADDAGNRSEARPERCEAVWAASPVLSLSLSNSVTTAGTLLYGNGTSAAQSNLVTVTISGGTFEPNWYLKLSNDANFFFIPPNNAMYVDASNLQGTFQAYYNGPPSGVGDPGPITIIVTISSTTAPFPKIPKQYFTSIPVHLI